MSKPEKFFHRARKALFQGKWQKADRQFRSCLAALSRGGEQQGQGLHLVLGAQVGQAIIYLQHRGDIPRAEQMLRDVLDADPHNLWALRVLADLQFELGGADAGHLLKRALSLDPENAGSLIKLGLVLVHQASDGNSELLQQAEGCLVKAKEVVDGQLAAEEKARRRRHIKNKGPKAITNARMVTALGAIGWLYVVTDRIGEAEECLTRCLLLNPLSFENRFRLAVAKHRKGDTTHALEIYEKLYLERPDHGGPAVLQRYARAIVDHQTDVGPAINMLRRALELQNIKRIERWRLLEDLVRIFSFIERPTSSK